MEKKLIFLSHVGLLHLRVRKRTPTPQVREQVFQSDHTLQLPSRGFLTTGPTTFFRLPIASQKPLMHHCERIKCAFLNEMPDEDINGN